MVLSGWWTHWCVRSMILQGQDPEAPSLGFLQTLPYVCLSFGWSWFISFIIKYRHKYSNFLCSLSPSTKLMNLRGLWASPGFRASWLGVQLSWRPWDMWLMSEGWDDLIGSELLTCRVCASGVASVRTELQYYNILFYFMDSFSGR